MVKGRHARWAGNVTCTGEGEVHIGFLWGYLRERDHLEDLNVDGRIILTFRNRASYI